MLAFVDLNLCGRDTAAVDPFDFEGGVEIEGGSGLVEDLWIDSGVDEGSEKHVAGDAGEAVEVGDAHGGIVSRRAGNGFRQEKETRRIFKNHVTEE